MHTPTSNHSDRLQKRMRLGTRSCTECRRRKVRCIFATDSRICNYCISHETQCTAQRPSRSMKEPEQDVQKKLDDLQGIVRRICKAIDLDVEVSSLSDFELGTMRALERLGHAPTPESSTDGSSSCRKESLDRWKSEGSTTSPDDLNSFEHAPLLNLIKEAMHIECSDQGGESAELSADQRLISTIQSLNALIPETESLDTVLAITEKYWFIWENYGGGELSKDKLAKSARPGETRVASARRWIQECMRSGNPILAAKAITHLSLCFQQLPLDFDAANLPASPKTLLQSYLDGVEILLGPESSSGTLEAVESYILLVKMYVDLGKPRQAWLNSRRAINLALLLGLHRTEENADPHRTALWNHICIGERIGSMSLGVPYAIQESALSLRQGAGAQEQLMFGLSIAAGHVNDRDQMRPRPDYSVTEQIEQELQSCKDAIPSKWWNMVPSSEMPFEVVYGHQTAKLQYYLVRKVLHLPYMLKSLTDNKYESSRIAALEASRGVLESYQGLHNNSGEGAVMCDLMDFMAFSAALTIVIYLLSPSTQRDLTQDTMDWHLIREVTKNQKRLSQMLACRVASQASQLLEYLLLIHDGTYTNPDGYEATIPYFGKIKISGVKAPEPQACSLGGQNNHTQATSWFSGPVEFTSSTFGDSFTGNFLSEAELGVDWTSAFEMDMNFDWSQTFEPMQSW